MCVMVIGPSGAGKTTLLKALKLLEDERPLRKTPFFQFSGKAIDTPGEFFDLPRFYHALITVSSRSQIILLLIDPTNLRQFPSRFTKSLRSKVIGVISKVDLVDEDQIKIAKKFLAEAGVEEVVCVSALTGEGIAALKQKIEKFIRRCVRP